MAQMLTSPFRHFRRIHRFLVSWNTTICTTTQNHLANTIKQLTIIVQFTYFLLQKYVEYEIKYSKSDDYQYVNQRICQEQAEWVHGQQYILSELSCWSTVVSLAPFTLRLHVHKEMVSEKIEPAMRSSTVWSWGIKCPVVGKWEKNYAKKVFTGFISRFLLVQPSHRQWSHGS